MYMARSTIVVMDLNDCCQYPILLNFGQNHIN